MIKPIQKVLVSPVSAAVTASVLGTSALKVSIWHCSSDGLTRQGYEVNWLVVWNMFFFHSGGNVIIPTDFFRGVGIPPAMWNYVELRN